MIFLICKVCPGVLLWRWQGAIEYVGPENLVFAGEERRWLGLDRRRWLVCKDQLAPGGWHSSGAPGLSPAHHPRLRRCFRKCAASEREHQVLFAIHQGKILLDWQTPPVNRRSNKKEDYRSSSLLPLSTKDKAGITIIKKRISLAIEDGQLIIASVFISLPNKTKFFTAISLLRRHFKGNWFEARKSIVPGPDSRAGSKCLRQ